MQIAAILRAKGSAVARVGSMSNVAEALKVLQQKRIGAVVVADDDTSVDGVLSERDIVRGLVEHGAEALDFPVTTLMTSDVITCSEDRTVDELLRDMTEHRIRHLPVLRDGHLAGIVSIGDLVKYRLDELVGERDAMRDYIATG
ncbi:MAG: CBS domain-containing protein [Rhodospirillaceae bacterium]|nr:CBS domain-containing protein [Rhodospirillaceae bacterium]